MKGKLPKDLGDDALESDDEEEEDDYEMTDNDYEVLKKEIDKVKIEIDKFHEKWKIMSGLKALSRVRSSQQ